MKTLKAVLLSVLVVISDSAASANVDYTSRSYINTSCELFAKDASMAALNYLHGVTLEEVLDLVDQAPVSPAEKDRLFQAVQLVWNNRIDNSVLAYTVAMGLCLKPRQQMAPIDDPWVTSPRTISGEY